MDDQEKSIFSYVEIALRRKWWIIIPFVAALGVSLGYYRYMPKIYKATTVILVQPQKIPESYVRSTITSSMADQLSTISEEILSRTRLEKIIEMLNPYPELKDKRSMEEIVGIMRRGIEVSMQGKPTTDRGQNAFSISFEGEEPKTVMLVTNQLASMFIEEHLRVREFRAEGTSDFLSKELTGVEQELIKKELEFKKFRERNMGRLPQQLDANLRILDRLQQQLQNIQLSIRAAQDRIVILQNQRDELMKTLSFRTSLASVAGEKKPGAGRDGAPEKIFEDPLVREWNQLRRDLESAQIKYTQNHPDIVMLKRKIASLEPRALEILEQQEAQRESVRKRLEMQTGESLDEKMPGGTGDPITERLLVQYNDQHKAASLEIDRLRTDENRIRQEILLYQKRVEDTPKLEQELLLLNRDYDILKGTYQSLLDKKIHSHMSENLEKRQQGEQFKVLDPARYPEKPFRPDLNRILMMGAGIGLLAGLGLGWFRESLDQTYHSEEDLEADLDLPILATIPNLKEERSLVSRR